MTQQSLANNRMLYQSILQVRVNTWDVPSKVKYAMKDFANVASQKVVTVISVHPIVTLEMDNANAQMM